MSKETVSLTASPEIGSKSGGYLRRSSGNSISPSSGSKNTPNYLRASTGSCHDLCKYGKNHGDDPKPVRPWHKKYKSPPSSNSLNKAENEAPVEIKTTTFVKLASSSSTARSSSPDFPKIKTLQISSPVSKPEKSSKRAPSSSKETSLPAKPNNLLKTKSPRIKPMPHSSPSGNSTSEEKKSASRVVDKNNVRNRELRTGENLSLLRKGVTLVKLKSAAEKLKPASLKSKPGNVKSKLATVKSSSAAYTSRGVDRPKDSEVKIEKKTGNSKMAIKKAQRLTTGSSPKLSLNRVPSLNARKHRSLKIATPLKNQDRLKKLEVNDSDRGSALEKILHVIVVETEKEPLVSAENRSPDVDPSPCSLSLATKSSPSPKSLSSSSRLEEDQEGSEYTVSEEDDSICDKDEIMDVKEALLGGGNSMKPENVIGADDDSDPVKLKFRRGKVIDPESEHTGPKKLRFRRGRVLGENDKSEYQRRRFKNRDTVDGEVVDTDAGSGKVVLRHQDVQGKKDAQGLFNNVIEETAIKLAETRKSKVKALVGAFETVISLQDGKPATSIGA